MTHDKFTLTGTGNDGFRHRYSVKKIEEFKSAFIKFMVALGFVEKKIIWSFMGGYYDENEEWVDVPLKVKEIEDKCWNYKNRKYDVDVFFGRFRIIIVVRTDERVPMVEHLEKEAGWIKPLEIKKLKEERKSKLIVPLRKVGKVN